MRLGDDDTIIHIACAADDNMLVPALALCHSVTRNARCAVHVHLIYSSLSASSVYRLKQVAAQADFHIQTYKSDRSLHEYTTSNDYPPSIFLRLELFDRMVVDRCIYLDADTMVRADLMDLWEVNLDGHVIAAVLDEAFVRMSNFIYKEEHCRPQDYMADVLSMETTRYLNSGVMVVDVNRWRALRLTDRILEFCSENTSLVMPDQDALNHVLDGKFISISRSYNAFVYLKYYLMNSEIEAVQDLIDEWRDPYIVHFTHKSKPWEAMHYPTDFDGEFWQKIDKTAVGGWLNERLNADIKMNIDRPGVKESAVESRAQRVARSYVLRKIYRSGSFATSLKMRWLGELMCTTAHLAGGRKRYKQPWFAMHGYGAAIIRESERHASGEA